MVRLTIELIRKRSEHNEGEISTLEEISLHQENIEKIELIDGSCKNLKILLLQHNLISKIENLGKLKRLEYLNLAINNIEAIENLEGLESLKKLDLTINFIGDLKGVKKLRCNENLEQLILTGNPCTYYEGYREYTISTLPQLKELDMVPIVRSERIKALQAYARAEGDVLREYQSYKKERQRQIRRHREKLASEAVEDTEGLDEETKNERFWKSTSYHTPEDRIAIAERSRRSEERKNVAEETTPKYVPKLFDPQGRPYNVNRAKVPFKLDVDNDPDNIILDVAVYKHLDTSYIDVDVQPEYVRVTIKGKVLQLSLPCEVSVGGSAVKRNVTTGSLVISMPRLNPLPSIGRFDAIERREKPAEKASRSIAQRRTGISKREYLEIGPAVNMDLELSTIVSRAEQRSKGASVNSNSIEKKGREEDFVDNPDVPALE
ncbi:hypothetical protein KM043_004256 [Ampulex compressa]|nr:hypothetical protein KM043_004256 [Ampulex compressa]